MSALEWGTLETDDGQPGGDLQVTNAASRRFITSSPAGFPVVLTVYAYGALIDGEGSRRDLQEAIVTETYLHGADLSEADPFDSEYAYAWPVDYWPESTLDEEDGEPSTTALEASAAAHLRNLPTAWLEAMPAPPEGVVVPS